MHTVAVLLNASAVDVSKLLCLRPLVAVALLFLFVDPSVLPASPTLSL